jgi:hypothetical protein
MALLVGLGGLRCSGRLTPQLDILRLMTLGLVRSPALSESLGEDLGHRVLMGRSDRPGGKIPAACGRCDGRPVGYG